MAELIGNSAAEDAAIGWVMELERTAGTGSGAATFASTLEVGSADRAQIRRAGLALIGM